LLFYIFLSHGNEKKNEKRGDAVSCPQVPVFILTLFKKNIYIIHSEKYGKIYVDVEGGKKENRKANQYVMPMSKFLQIYNQSNIYMVYDVAKEMKGTDNHIVAYIGLSEYTLYITKITG
jgi:hypothetical protein